MPPHIHVNTNNQSSASDTEQYHVRAMTTKDLPAVVQIDQTTWGDQAWSVENHYDNLDDLDMDCWILENRTNPDQILGYGIQRLINGIAHIISLCLHPDQCGQGLGGILLRYMIDYARWLAVPIIALEVNTSNARAYNLYVKHGFMVADLIEKYYSETEDAYRMQLILIE